MLGTRKEIIMLKFELGVWVTQEFPSGWSHVLIGSFADSPFDTQMAPDLFCYDENTGIGAFFTTFKNGQFDNDTALPNGPHKVGGNHFFSRQWTHVVYIPIPAMTSPAPRIDKLLLFYDAASGEAEVYETDGRGNLILKKQHNGWSMSWTQIIAGQFGKANLLFYNAAHSVGESCSINKSGDIQLIEGWS
jgi:hypothetical protein